MLSPNWITINNRPQKLFSLVRKFFFALDKKLSLSVDQVSDGVVVVDVVVSHSVVERLDQKTLKMTQFVPC